MKQVHRQVAKYVLIQTKQLKEEFETKKYVDALLDKYNTSRQPY